MALTVVPPYAALLAVVFVALSLRVIGARRLHRIPLGATGNADLERRMRVHANFAEYAPFALLLLAMAELRGSNPLLLHGASLCLVVGRCVHAWGVSQAPENFRLRVVGMAATFAAILGAAMLLLVG